MKYKAENKEMIKKEVIILIRQIYRRFMKFDFLLYTETPRDLNNFYTNKKTKEKYKKITFKYKDKTKVVYDLTKYQYQVWRANFPMNNFTNKNEKKK